MQEALRMPLLGVGAGCTLDFTAFFVLIDIDDTKALALGVYFQAENPGFRS
jgi:hypothetical protein